MAVVADPQVNRLLTPADDAVELVFADRTPADRQNGDRRAPWSSPECAAGSPCSLSPAASSVSCSSRRVPEVSDSSSSQLEIARAPVFIQQLRDIVLSPAAAAHPYAQRQVDAVENFRYGVLQRRKNVAMPVEFITTLFRRRPPRASARRRRSTAASRDAASRIRADGYNNR